MPGAPCPGSAFAGRESAAMAAPGAPARHISEAQAQAAMAATDPGVRLPKVGTRTELLDHLESVIIPPKDEDAEEPRGRMRELKTFVLESDGGFPRQFAAGGVEFHVVDTGMDDVKILHAANGGDPCEFFLDVRDKRYCLLHTNDRSDEARHAIRALAMDHRQAFDHAWFYSDMLKGFCGNAGNTFKGFGVKYTNKLIAEDDDADLGIEDLQISISGSLAREIQGLVEKKKDVARAMAYNKVRVIRRSSDPGAPGQDFVHDDIDNTGYFVVKRGKSVDDHLALVNMCKDEYSRVVCGVEDMRIGVGREGGRATVEGSPFHLEFPNPIEDLDSFVPKMFNSAAPFRLWGFDTKIRDGYTKVLAVDLHTGSPLDFEITSDMMRVYLFKGSCGNTLMRLLTNLQVYYDSGTRCDELAQ